MEKDIVPDLLDSIMSDFDESLRKNDKIIEAIKLLEKNKANFKNANEFSIEVGNVLSEVLKNNISSDILPDGKMYYNIADRILNPSMGKAHDLISDYSKDVQTVLNNSANLGITGLQAELNQDRIDGIINKMVVADNYDDVAWLLDEPIKNFCQSIVDDTIKTNVQHHYKLGLKPVIKRISTGNCCDWCDNIQGVYEYPDDVPDDIYKRHRYCRCRVDYYPGDGKKQNVWNKKWTDVNESEKIIKRRNISQEGLGYNNRLKNITYSKAQELGYTPLSQEEIVYIMRKKSQNWINTLTEDEKKAILKYTYNGKDRDGLKLFQKINGYLEGYYNPINSKEEIMILNYYSNIKNAILKNNLDDDIIVYRNDTKPHLLGKNINKFLSTSISQKGVLGGKPNVAIIVPKKSNGAYIENLSFEKFKKQREFLLNSDTNLEIIENIDNMYIYKVRGEIK